MDEWKEQIKEYVIYCKEDRKEAWINDIDALDLANFSDLTYREFMYEDQKKSFIKTAEIMKALDEGETWVQIVGRIMEGKEYCQYPIYLIGHMMLTYSKHGIEFVEVIIGKTLELNDALQEEYNEEVEKVNKQVLG